MAIAEIDILDHMAGRSLTGAEALFSELRSQIADSAASIPFYMPQASILSTIARVLQASQPTLVDHLADSEVAAWTLGMDAASRLLPRWLTRDFSEGRFGRSPPDKPIRLMQMFDDEPRLRFPLIEQAAERLAERNILTRAQWEAASREAQDRAFFITADITRDTIGKVRESLLKDIEAGPSLRSFESRVVEALEKSPIGPAHLENVYRTNIQASFRDGRETLVNNPVVASIFPYQEYLPIHDARTRPHHAELGKLGLNGTGVYRRDDPFWDRFTPPWDYQCRCGVRLLTIEAAARKGVREAKEWLESGVPPAKPEWRNDAIPFPSRPGFGSRGRVAA